MPDIEAVKREVKKEFSRRKKTEEGLKLSHVYNDIARRNGFKDWNAYSAALKNQEIPAAQQCEALEAL